MRHADPSIPSRTPANDGFLIDRRQPLGLRMRQDVILDICHDDEDAEWEAAEKDGPGCLRHLLASRSPFGPTMRELLATVAAEPSLKKALRSLGVAADPEGQWACVAVAGAHPALSRIFSSSFWSGSWSRTLMTIEGARPGRRILFGQHYSASVVLPKAVFDAAPVQP